MRAHFTRVNSARLVRRENASTLSSIYISAGFLLNRFVLVNLLFALLFLFVYLLLAFQKVGEVVSLLQFLLPKNCTPAPPY